ncbi:MAG TPA: hypothetical protein PK926_13125 [Spirochaetota bacterium]|nr:hypothetical protein [Spirochaetota bacterium]HPI89575.1 hypothetical protein [Spirochaetota bacterium]HPR49039.1 hypothetical protein [Spirochaetota bacterium]
MSGKFFADEMAPLREKYGSLVEGRTFKGGHATGSPDLFNEAMMWLSRALKK